MSSPTRPTVFISYSHKDKEWRDRLVTHLNVLSQQGLLVFWDDRQIGAGEDWYEQIQEAINAAQVAILLVSADFLTSDFILREEIIRLLQRRDREGLRIFPIILRSCPWDKVDWLRRMQVRPRDKPLASYRGNRRDEALSKIATEVYNHIKTSRAAAEPQKVENKRSRRIDIKRLPITGSDLFGRESELQQLDEAWASRNTNVLSLVAWGGVGKSALVNYWLARIARADYVGATRVYAWSFYSQSTTDKAVSADQFMDAALKWFGDADPNKGSPWEKGERLAHLVGRHRTLLIVDGLEPLQYPPGPDEGRLKGHALQAFLRQLAAYNEGLCVISTRVPVSDLSSFEGHTTKRINLDSLSPTAGAQVLKAQGVKGAQSELEQASREFGGHSLALTLLGSYLSDVFAGDISRRGDVKGLEEDERHGRHAEKVMASYERWLGEGPELAILRILGLFDRPADGPIIEVLRDTPTIPGLTDGLEGLSDFDWHRVVAKLRHSQLLAALNPNHPATLDTHPLVREHFGRQLKQARPDAWREGNNRLYEHLKQTSKEFPDTLDEVVPLYAAVTHGCEAGRHQEALDEVYCRRILRENFSTSLLGSFGAGLAALIGFFEVPWKQPVPGLSNNAKAFVLNEAGYCLRALGRLREAVQPMQAGLASHLEQQDWANAAIDANNLSELQLTIGDLSQALTYTRQSAELVERNGSSFWRIAFKTTLADVLHQSGRLSEAEEAFLQAEEVQKERHPEMPFLYSFPNFRYCDLLLTQGNHEDVIERANESLDLAILYANFLDIALNQLALGRAYLLQSELLGNGDFTEATDLLNQAVDSLGQAGTLHHLPRALLARAHLHRVKAHSSRAESDLGEAMSIATRGGMGLHEADCHLEYARLYLAQDEKDKARQHWAVAKGMIKLMGYHRRDKDLKEIEEQLGTSAQ